MARRTVAGDRCLRSARLDGAPLDYAPDNELGVVYLFSHLAKKRFGLRIESIQSCCPDCVARQSGSGKRIRIEFEYRSRNFAQHKHDPKQCDWIVCWIHDWPAAPKRLRVVELRKEYGVGFNVWLQPVADEYREAIGRDNYWSAWSVASRASEGDLVLFYRTRPDAFIKDIFRIAGPVGHVRAGWKKGMDWMAPVRRVCRLKAPLHYQQLKDDPVLGSAGFVRGSMQGRRCVSEYWPEIHRMIVARNPAVRRTLGKFGPEKLAQ